MWSGEKLNLKFLARWTEGKILHQTMYVLTVDDHAWRGSHGRVNRGRGIRLRNFVKASSLIKVRCCKVLVWKYEKIEASIDQSI